ncbi:hypothetical protein Y032_0128g1460 [Ancylostoma ceylanicum]|uniref:Uncharacterized protein n=1 Tax=Ancylostoma ceylanicum TaxID=53326 RepID=A0A016T872_9BILA|nr:hypothetical protein Y032_0128g1460 [Ancylostoma ceylanicum]
MTVKLTNRIRVTVADGRRLPPRWAWLPSTAPTNRRRRAAAHIETNAHHFTMTNRMMDEIFRVLRFTTPQHDYNLSGKFVVDPAEIESRPVGMAEKEKARSGPFWN